MSLRSKVTLLCVLCILYLFVFTLPSLHSSQTIKESVEPSWRWQFDDDTYDAFSASRPAPPYRSPPPPSDISNPIESSIVTSITSNSYYTDNNDNNNNNNYNEQQDPERSFTTTTPPTTTLDPNEKFITFFTHSGFQNQLIQVENGILLAWYLNRTLILPRALLGEAFGWSYFGKLHLEHTLHDPYHDESMPAKDSCEFYAEELAFWDIECPDPTRYATMPFDEIFDLSWAKQHVRIVLRERSDFEWLDEKYGIKRGGDDVPELSNGSYVDGDILFFKGETRYDWRIFDTPRKSHRLGKYAEGLDIYQLRKRKERLIHFSSLFGTGKLPIRRPEHYTFLHTLQRSIIYRHPTVLSVADKIVNALGGPGNFIGLHVRSSDGWFVKALPENIYNIEQGQGLLLQGTQQKPDLQQCLDLAKVGKATLIYMATDARSPRSNIAFDPIWSRYPCTFTMDDLLVPTSPFYHELDAAVDERTGSSLRKFLLPLVDATIASRGWFFIGSKGSTFSGYIYRLHDVYWANAKLGQQLQS
ncbi:hypothetical protein BDB00DRAFT_950194 [Zychaea mexicana]|uniref:uncharacterized protein n=1 Tax=Zychaea mexicana TaxID=64656 RepID=UPI0022FE0197|nr:uncharacterized protein BDB00DRAFT_950194 [Zychaea mexicana]KAI9498375.1 hypothetical protein BDB00DRAFT_950194 [Zychaea mexicana]